MGHQICTFFNCPVYDIIFQKMDGTPYEYSSLIQLKRNIMAILYRTNPTFLIWIKNEKLVKKWNDVMAERYYT